VTAALAQVPATPWRRRSQRQCAGRPAQDGGPAHPGPKRSACAARCSWCLRVVSICTDNLIGDHGGLLGKVSEAMKAFDQPATPSSWVWTSR